MKKIRDWITTRRITACNREYDRTINEYQGNLREVQSIVDMTPQDREVEKRIYHKIFLASTISITAMLFLFLLTETTTYWAIGSLAIWLFTNFVVMEYRTLRVFLQDFLGTNDQPNEPQDV